MTRGQDWKFVQAAKRLFTDEGTLEVDDGATVSRNDVKNESDGAYVQAWVWVSNQDARQEKRTA